MRYRDARDDDANVHAMVMGGGAKPEDTATQQTLDTKPGALLSAARLAEIRRIMGKCISTIESGFKLAHEDIDALLLGGAQMARALDALQAPALNDGGEALGESLLAQLADGLSPTWAKLLHDIDDARWSRAALVLDAAGYARGLSAALAVAEKDRDAEIARLKASYAGVCEQALGQAATIARLEGELAAERALSAELRAMEIEALTSADRWRAASERANGERDTARLDGAREERRLCIEDLIESGPDTPELIEAHRRIDARPLLEPRATSATEGRQG